MRNKRHGYFSGPKSEIVKEVLGVLFLAGALTIASTSPLFIKNIIKGFKKLDKYPHKKVYDTFYRLREQGDVVIDEKGGQIFISLTNKGKRKAGWMRIDDLLVKRPEKWDGKWRVLLFDIKEMKRMYREALRGKLISTGFIMLQKSVWVIPFNCAKEVEILKSFFGLSNEEIRLLVVDDIGEDKKFRKDYKIS